MMRVLQVEHVDERLVEAFGRLLPQLSSKSRRPTLEDLRRLIATDSNVVFVALDDDQIVGALTLVLIRIPTGLRARIEDVVVDEASRGHGVARLLSEAALHRAAAEGAMTVDLTSRSDRVAANRLYQSLGFELRDTNVYRIELIDD